MNKSDDIYDIINLWLHTVRYDDSKEISKLYAKNAVLLGTVAENVKQGRAVIKTYFDEFKKKNPVGVLNSIIFQDLGKNYGSADGNYTFELDEKCGDEIIRVKVPARYTFVVNTKTKLIQTHHSSSTPENKPTAI